MLSWLCCMYRMGMPNIDWSTINMSNMSILDVVDFKTAGAVRTTWECLMLNTSCTVTQVSHNKLPINHGVACRSL